MPPKKTCKDCVFYRVLQVGGEGNGHGECKCYAPRAGHFIYKGTVDSDGGHFTAHWPVVDGSQETCGEFKNG